MKRDHKPRSGIALGGIGTGSVELRADGVFYNWNIFNNNPFGTGPSFPFPENSMLFFIVRYEEQGCDPKMKILQIDSGNEVGGILSHIYQFPWMTGVDETEYEGVFPFVRMRFRDADMPLDVELEAFSPFVPHDVDASSLPCAAFRFNVRSRAKRPVHVMLMASMRSGVGYDVEEKTHRSRLRRGKSQVLFEHGAGRMSKKHASWGTQALASLSRESTYYLGWEHLHPYYEIVIRSRELPDVDDSAGRNSRDPKTGRLKGMSRFFSTVARSVRLARGKSFEHDFVMAWHFPNLYSENQEHVEGHRYASRFRDAASVAEHVANNLGDLRSRSRAFVDDLYASTVPEFVLDQVNSQLNTLHTGAWLTKKGDFGIQEGMTQAHEYGPLATMDVGMYGSVSTAALFPELDKAMFRAHKRLQMASGEIGHGIARDFRRHDEREVVTERIDLVPQYAIMVLRGYFWTGDRAYLEEMWTSVKRALEFSAEHRDPNRDGLPDHKGAKCTYDNFPMFGAGSYSGSLWLAALVYAVKAAGVMRDTKAEARFSELLARARDTFERKLWNGSYYRLYNDEGGERGDLDEGCLVDQLIGQWATDMIGAGSIVRRDRVRKALRRIVSLCFRPEQGLRNAAWPGDAFLHPVEKDVWVDQANTCWTGVELAFASFLIYEGLVHEGLKVVRNVDRRYRKAGMYWDHQEFGGHYYRPMSAWAILNALAGLTIDGDAYGFAPRLPERNQRLFFAFGSGTAHFAREVKGRRECLAVEVKTGTFRCREIAFELVDARPRKVATAVAGKRLSPSSYDVGFEEDGVHLRFRRGVSARACESVTVTVG
jgi:uncharacterized protein (DUF608 family)